MAEGGRTANVMELNAGRACIGRLDYDEAGQYAIGYPEFRSSRFWTRISTSVRNRLAYRYSWPCPDTVSGRASRSYCQAPRYCRQLPRRNEWEPEFAIRNSRYRPWLPAPAMPTDCCRCWCWCTLEPRPGRSTRQSMQAQDELCFGQMFWAYRQCFFGSMRGNIHWPNIMVQFESAAPDLKLGLWPQQADVPAPAVNASDSRPQSTIAPWV